LVALSAFDFVEQVVVFRHSHILVKLFQRRASPRIADAKSSVAACPMIVFSRRIELIEWGFWNPCDRKPSPMSVLISREWPQDEFCDDPPPFHVRRAYRLKFFENASKLSKRQAAAFHMHHATPFPSFLRSDS
jgi:hypothetical protein